VKKLLVLAIVCALLLAVIGAVAFLRPPSLQSSARRAWKERSIADIASRVAAASWPTNEFARLKPVGTNEPSDDACWLTDQIILTRKREWLAYANSVTDRRNRVGRAARRAVGWGERTG